MPQHEHTTSERLNAAVFAETVTAARRTILGLILRQQIADIETGIPPGPRVEVKSLGRAERAALRDVLQRGGDAVSVVREGVL